MPAGLLGAVIVFWGWQADLLPIAVFMGLLAEVPSFSSRRFKLSSRDWEAIADVCTCLLVLLFFYLAFTQQTRYLVIFLLEFLPLPLFPLLVAQRLSTQDRIDLSALFYILRKRRKKTMHYKSGNINFEYLYFGLCLLSAGAANQRTIWYYVLAFVFVSCLLWYVKPKSTPIYTWALFVLFAGILGFGGQLGLQGLQQFVRERVVSSFYHVSPDNSLDLFQSGTSLGKSKRISDQIVFRVDTQKGSKQNKVDYIRKAVFNVTTGKEWYASRKFAAKRVKVLQTNNSYILNPEHDASSESVRIFKKFDKDKDYLLLPRGTLTVDNLAVSNLQITSTGTAIVKDPQRWLGYRVKYHPGSSILGKPTESDLQIPDRINKQIDDTAFHQDIRDMNDPVRVIRILQRFFRKEFTYSLDVKFKSEPLQKFLWEKRAGDCEYFATAAALLLRSAGIPCRYVTGYLVHECNLNSCVVRKSDAHAWVVAFVNGEWKRIDPTPPGIAYQNPGWIREVKDFFSHLGFEFNKWRYRENNTNKLIYLCLIILGAVMFWGVLKRWLQKKTYITTSPLPAGYQGDDSEFYRIEKHLEKQGIFRPADEPLLQWIRKQDDPLLEDIAKLHYKYRFDPRGLSKNQRRSLKDLVDKWFQENKQ